MGLGGAKSLATDRTRRSSAPSAAEAALAAVGLPGIDHTGLPSVQLQAVDASDTDTEESPTRTVRSVIRDENGYITAVVDEEIA
jgi:hypothetical protein